MSQAIIAFPNELVASLRDAITVWCCSSCYRALHPLRDAEKAGRLPSPPTDCATFDFSEWAHTLNSTLYAPHYALCVMHYALCIM